MLENLRQYLNDVPKLAELLERALHENPANVSNTEDLRFHLEDLQTDLAKRLKDEKQLYSVLHFPEQELKCPTCGTLVMGYYWELNNPATGKGQCVSNALFHALVAHEEFFQTEMMYNVSGTRVGETRQVLDLAALLAVVEGSSAPAEIVAELKTAIELQARKLAESAAPATAGGGH